MSYEIEWRPGAIEDITALFEYLVENASLWDARNVTERLITATDRLADYPRLIRRQLVLPTRANYTGRTLQCDIKSRLLLPSLSFSCSFHLSVRTYIRDGSAGLPPPPP